MRIARPLALWLPSAAVVVGLFALKNAWAAVLLFHGTLLALLWAGRSSAQVGALLRSRSLGLVIGCVLLCGSGGVVLYLAWPLLDAAPDLGSRLAELGLTPAAWPGFIGYFVLINPWLEELFWRGYLGSFERGPAPSDLFYAGYHLLVIYDKIAWTWSLLALAALIFAGWFWRQVTRSSGGLLAAAVSHMAADFSILTAVYWIVVKG